MTETDAQRIAAHGMTRCEHVESWPEHDAEGVCIAARGHAGPHTYIDAMGYTRRPSFAVVCHYCGQRHTAEPSHMGRYGEGQIYAVVCPDPVANRLGVIDYYTGESLA